MSAEKYVCFACEDAGRGDSIVELTPQGKCPNCGSENVISEAVVRAYAASRNKRATQEPEVVIRETPVNAVYDRLAANAQVLERESDRDKRRALAIRDCYNFRGGKMPASEAELFELLESAFEYGVVEALVDDEFWETDNPKPPYC